MSLKSGRVGVNPSYVNPVDGSIILPPQPTPTDVYSKTECDDKFLSKAQAASDYLSKTDASSTYLEKIAADSWSAASQVANGSVSFSGIDDSVSHGYSVFFDLTSANDYYANLTAVSDPNTDHMSVTYKTNAPNGTYAYLRILK